MPGAEDDSRFAGSVPEFAAQGKLAQGWTSSALRAFRPNLLTRPACNNRF
jgi:hypothetical protein